MSKVREITGHPRADSLWRQTSGELTLVEQLQQNKKTDVLVIGAGFTGLSTALHLVQNNIEVTVIDAYQPGWGASGRNGGQVNPTLKHDPGILHKMYGDKADALIQAVSSSADLVFDLINKYRINCSPQRAGWIQASYTESGSHALYKRADEWRQYGIPVRDLGQAEIQKMTGSRSFKGGWLDTRAGSLQPFAYVNGLARAAQQLGVQIYGDSPVIKLARNSNKWVATTAKGFEITTDRVVLATNAYTDGLFPNLAQTFLQANSFIVATEPLGDKTKHIFANGETLSTAQRLLLYIRKDDQGRILMGGRGDFSDPKTKEDYAHLERSINILYPELKPFKFEYRWAGRIAITKDFMPHVHQPQPGITIALGYNGRGIATATAMGKHIADMLAKDSTNDFPFPVTTIKRLPFHSLQRFYITAGVAWYSMLDAMSL